MDGLADRLDDAADSLGVLARSLPTYAPPAGAFGADDEGRPGRLGRALHGHWAAVLAARSGEAAVAAAGLAGTARHVRSAAAERAAADRSAADRFGRLG